MRIVIIGAGAIGGYVGGSLAAAGKRPVVVNVAADVDAVRPVVEITMPRDSRRTTPETITTTSIRIL